MKVSQTALREVLLVEPRVFSDERGEFLEAYNYARYKDAGIPTAFVQDNLSISRRGVLRGLHWQSPNAQGKLVSVFAGEVYDVVVDIRIGSRRFGQWIGIRLSSANARQLYIPPGFAHGFLASSSSAVFHYKCTVPYHPASERSIIWNDPTLGIDWPLRDVTLSEKDAASPLLADLCREYLPTMD
jgi:dTDP-4-dehydrorhamnose 3,5-epimerase